jgi:antitoxin MazE
MFKQMRMQTTVQKWGNSLAVRIPGTFCKETGLKAGLAVEISVEIESIIIKPVHKKYTLSELLNQVNESNLHYEIIMGEPKGREIW